ncbi:hypothetical protein AXK58_21315 [Tsukamurella tyrosinosolvens]|nr:hypothetical protein AXK58_21315 [Tsukamurella tyrosinosolvens]
MLTDEEIAASKGQPSPAIARPPAPTKMDTPDPFHRAGPMPAVNRAAFDRTSAPFTNTSPGMPTAAQPQPTPAQAANTDPDMRAATRPDQAASTSAAPDTAPAASQPAADTAPASSAGDAAPHAQPASTPDAAASSAQPAAAPDSANAHAAPAADSAPHAQPSSSTPDAPTSSASSAAPDAAPQAQPAAAQAAAPDAGQAHAQPAASAGQAPHAAPSAAPSAGSQPAAAAAQNTSSAAAAKPAAQTGAHSAANAAAKGAGAAKIQPAHAPNPSWKSIGNVALKGQTSGITGKGFKAAPVSGVKKLLTNQVRTGQTVSNMVGKKAIAKLGAKGIAASGIKLGARALPIAGSIIGAYVAYQNFKEGDWVGGVLGVVSMIPGPIGWIGLGASALWETFGGGAKTFPMWEAPDGTSTYILQASAKDAAGVQEADAGLRDTQAGVFSFQDGPNGTVWGETPPDPILLNTPEVAKALTDWLGGLTDLFAQVDQELTSSGEPYLTQYRQSLLPHLTAMAKLKDQIGDLNAQLKTASDSAGTAYKAVLTGNRAVRDRLSTDGKVGDSAWATTMKNGIEKGVAGLSGANEKITKLFATAPPPALTSKYSTTAGNGNPEKAPDKETKPNPTPSVTPSAVAPSATPGGKTPATQTPSTPAAQTPITPSVKSPLSSNPLGTGGGSPLGSGLGGGSPLSSSGAKPLETGSNKLESPSKKLDDKDKDSKKLDDKRSDERKDTKPRPLSTARPDQNAAGAAPAAAGKQDTAIKPPAPLPQPTPEGAAKPGGTPEAPKTGPQKVDFKGQQIEFPDPKTAKLAQILGAADPTKPVSLADAAAQAGLNPPVPGQDPGKQVAPVDAKPGDVLVAGDKKFMLLGDGKFYDLQDYKTIGSEQLPKDLGSRGGYFHLTDPTAQQGGAAPVSGQTGGVPFGVPGGAAPQAGAIDPAAAGSGTAPNADPPKDPPAGGSQPPAGGGAQPPAGGGGVPASGSPGVPSKGAPGSGPANAAATDTGAGSNPPSASTQALDPSGVR